MERLFFPTKIEARSELARVGLISKQHYHSQMIQFDVLDDPRWQANIEAKQGRFYLTVMDPSPCNTEAWSINHAIIIGFLTPQIFPGLTVPVKTQNTNIKSSIH